MFSLRTDPLAFRDTLVLPHIYKWIIFANLAFSTYGTHLIMIWILACLNQLFHICSFKNNCPSFFFSWSCLWEESQKELIVMKCPWWNPALCWYLRMGNTTHIGLTLLSFLTCQALRYASWRAYGIGSWGLENGGEDVSVDASELRSTSGSCC